MLNWSKVTLAGADQVENLVRRAREDVRRGAPDGVGVFRARQGLALFFSPVATDAIRLSSALALEDCPRPDPMNVEVVVGPSDEPAWYDQPAGEITDQLDLAQADDMGMLGPDTEIDELLTEMRLARG